MKSNNVLAAFRLLCGVAFVVVGILVFGPFGDAEARFGLTDKEAHVIAFFGLTALSLLAAPRLRKLEIAIFLVGIGGLIEIVQGLVGRDGDVMDWLADSFGVALSLVPMYFERLRQTARGVKIAHPRRRRSDRVSVGVAGQDRNRTAIPIDIDSV